MPLPNLAGAETVLLAYTHFSVLMRLDKRLAAVTGLGIDGGKLMDLDRSVINWRLDPRLREDQQTGERVCAWNDIDRGHLVRRVSAVWGPGPRQPRPMQTPFHYTSAAPQAAEFNQGLELWLGMESYLLDHAADYRGRLAVFTGPIFSDLDPVCRGVDIPQRYFKVAVAPDRGHGCSLGPTQHSSRITGRQLPSSSLGACRLHPSNECPHANLAGNAKQLGICWAGRSDGGCSTPAVIQNIVGQLFNARPVIR